MVSCVERSSSRNNYKIGPYIEPGPYLVLIFRSCGLYLGPYKDQQGLEVSTLIKGGISGRKFSKQSTKLGHQKNVQPNRTARAHEPENVQDTKNFSPIRPRARAHEPENVRARSVSN
jgi:hypothetical protein